MYITGNEIVVSQVPSACPGLTYAEADAVVRRLRSRGTSHLAFVATLTGSPVTAEMLHAAREEKAEPSLPSTRKELDRIPAAEYKRRSQNEPSFRRRADELEAHPRGTAR
jgi:hypothetical protein